FLLQARMQADPLAAAHGVARPHLAVVQADVARADPGRQARTREFGEQLGQDRIEAAPGGGFGDAGLAWRVVGVTGIGHGRLRFRRWTRRTGTGWYYPPFVPCLPRCP